jgi:hypothetical protein
MEEGISSKIFFDCCITLFPVTQNINYLQLFQQNVRGVDYEDDKSILQAVDPSWWLKHKSCKYMLTCLIHTDNLDISTKPTETPPGITHKDSRIEKVAALATEHIVDKTKCSPPPINEMDHQCW